MNLAKKMLVVLLVATLLVSCFALFSSAEAPKLTLDNLEDMYEYYTEKDSVYIDESYDNVVIDDGVTETLYPAKNDWAWGQPEYWGEKYTYRFAHPVITSKVVIDPANSENKCLKIDSNGTGDGRNLALSNYYVDCNELVGITGIKLMDKVVVSFDVRVDDPNGNGATVEISANGKAYFYFDFSNPENPNYKYYGYNPNGNQADAALRPIPGAAPKLNTWYTVEAVLNFDENSFVVDVFEKDSPENKTTTGTVMFAPKECDVKDSQGKVGATVVSVTSNSKAIDADLAIYFDDMEVYYGSFVRDVHTPEKAMNEFLASVSEFAESASADDKVRIARFYDTLFFDESLGMKYSPVDDGSEAYATVMQIKAGTEAFYNRAFAEALIDKTTKLKNNEVVGYYNRIDLHADTEEFYNFFPDELEAEIANFPGVEDMVESILAAKDAYEQEFIDRERVRQNSIRFVNLVEGFDYENDNYVYIKAYVKSLEDCKGYDPTFRYSDVKEIPEDSPEYDKETTIASFVEDFNEIINTLHEIDANADVFVAAITALPDTPEKTKNFASIYENYLKASSVFSKEEGTIHESLNIDTYPLIGNVTLRECTAKYYAIDAYVAERIALSKEFIRKVDEAAASATYKGTLAFLDEAAIYIDADIDNKSVETEYAGVSDAIAKYNALREKLRVDVANADAYKAAVTAIDMAAPYTQLKAGVEAALALKEAGAIVGIDGVMEANIKLTEADSKVKMFEGNSATLIASVAKLKDAKTLAERREIIFTATNAAKGAEDAIAGVSAAKAELEAATAKFNADVAAANAGFFTAVKNLATASASAIDASGAYQSADLAGKIVK